MQSHTLATTQPQLPLQWRSDSGADPGATRRSSPSKTPHRDLERVAGRLAGAIAEVYCGTRPVGQLRPYLSPREFSRMTSRRPPSAAANGPIRSVLSVHVAPGARTGVEVCAVVQGRRRCLAVAMHLRPHRGSWQATAVAIE